MAPKKKGLSAASAANAASHLADKEVRVQSLGAFKFGRGRLATANEAPDTSYDIPQHLRVYLQHMGKNDPRTREKAMRNLNEYLTESPPDADVQTILRCWAKQLPKLSLSPVACQLTLTLFRRAGKGMGRVIHDVFPPLFFGQYSQDAAVSNAAVEALQGMLGEKMDTAVCDVCFDRLVDAIESISVAAPDANSTDWRQPFALLGGAREILDRLTATGKDPSRMLAVMQGMDAKSWLRSPEGAVRRQAYSTCASLSGFAQSLDDEFIPIVYGCLGVETDGSNYTHLMTMILMFGRDTRTWAAIQNPEIDFHRPTRRIATAIDESSALAKCFLPLLAVTPKRLWLDKSLAKLLLAMQQGPKVSETIRECLQYISTNGMASLVVDHADFFTTEDAIQRIGPLLAAMSAISMEMSGRGSCAGAGEITEAFNRFQAEILERSLALSTSFWVSGNISFAYQILGNTRSGSNEGADNGGVPAPLNDRLYNRLVERAATSGFEGGLVDALGQMVEGKIFQIDHAEGEFDRIIQDLADRLGDRAAAQIIDAVDSIHDISSSKSLDGVDSVQPGPSPIRTLLLSPTAFKAVSTGNLDALHLSKSLMRFTCGEQLRSCLNDTVALSKSSLSLTLPSESPSASPSSLSIVLDLMAAVAQQDPAALSTEPLLSFAFSAVWNNLDSPIILASAEAVFNSQDDISVVGRLLDEISPNESLTGDTIDEDTLHRLFCAISFCVASAKHGRKVLAFSGFVETFKRFPDVTLAVLAHQSTSLFAEIVVADVDIVLESLWRSRIDDRETVIRLALSSPTSYVSLLDRAFQDKVVDTEDRDAEEDGVGAILVELVQRGIQLEETLCWCRSTLFSANSVRRDWRVSQLAALEAAVYCIRTDHSLLERSGLLSFSLAVLGEEEAGEITDGMGKGSEIPETVKTGKLMRACYPDCWDNKYGLEDDEQDASQNDDVVGHRPFPVKKKALHNSGLTCCDELQPRTTVWYADSTTTKKGIILSRDDSIQPPSFVVDLGDGIVRETEANRLRLARVGPLLLGPPGITKQMLLDSTEIDKAIRVISSTVNGKDGSIDSSTPFTLSTLRALWALRAMGVHGWERLQDRPTERKQSNLRSSIVDIVVECSGNAAIEMDRTISMVSKEFTERVTAATGTSIAEAADALDVLATIRENETLRRAPAIMQLHNRLHAVMEGALVSFAEAHSEAIAAAVRVFLWDGWETMKKNKNAGSELSKSILSVFYGIGWMLAATRAIFAVPTAVWHREDVSSLLRSLAAGVRAVDVRRPDALRGDQGIPLSLLPSQVLSVCLNGGISRPLAAAGFAVLLRRPEELAMAWSTDPDAFFGDVDAEDIHDGENADGVGNARVFSPTRPRDKMVDLNPLVRAAIEGDDPTSDDFQTAWLVLTSYLASPEVDPAQQELLVLTLKDAGVTNIVLSGTLVELLGSSGESVTRGSRLGGPGYAEMSLFIDPGAGSLRNEDLLAYLRHTSLDVPPDVRMLALMSTLPVASRSWYVDHLKVRHQKTGVEAFVKRNVAPLLIRREIETLERDSLGDEAVDGPNPDASDKFTVKVTGSNVLASLEIEDGQSIDLSVSFPSLFPLKAGTAKLERTPGISEDRKRRWQMSVELVLRNRSGDVSEAIKLWRRSVNGVFEGMENCLICYAVIDPVSGALPRRKCRTCGIKVHSSCLLKWIGTSGRSECVHCRSSW